MKTLPALALAASLLAIGAGEAAAQESYHVNGPLRLTIRARSFLDAGNTVAPYSRVNPASAYGQTVAYLANPPYNNFRDRFGSGTLPDPIDGPFIGARSAFGPVDFGGTLD